MNTKRKTIMALLSGMTVTGWVSPKINAFSIPAHAMTTGMAATTTIKPVAVKSTGPEDTTTTDMPDGATTTTEPMSAETTTTEEPMPEETTTTTMAPREPTPAEKYYNSQVAFRDNRMDLPDSHGGEMKRGEFLGSTDTFTGTVMAEGINPAAPDAVYTFEVSVNTTSRGENVHFLLFKNGGRIASYGTRVMADGTWDSFDITVNPTGFDGAYYGTGIYGRICAPGVFGTYEVTS